MFFAERVKRKTKEIVTSPSVGAFIRIFRQRERMASVTLEELLLHRISRQDELYFSIVLRSECWASLESLSTSFNTRTDMRQKMLLIERTHRLATD